MEDKQPTHLLEEEKARQFWRRAGIFQISVERPAPKGDYVFYDGPPFATGTMHYGHMVGQIMKDVVPRFWTMNGYRVERKWGWDCHGLPIENLVEKELGITNKQQIVELGIEKFNELCRSKVLSYVDEWKKAVDKLGRWADMENDYKTMDLPFMESVWWVFKQLWDKDLVYEGYRSMHVCPRCETTLSQAEVSEGYKDIKDLSVVAKFELVDEPGTFVLAWTTTPWTLPGNVALAVSADMDYVKIKKDDAYFILAKDEFEKKRTNEELISTFKGAELADKRYKPLFPYYAADEKLSHRENGWKICTADFVVEGEGTGVVHIAPGYGEDDLNLGKKEHLPFVQHVGMDGVIKKEVKELAGLHVKPKDDVTATDVAVIKYLAEKNLLFAKGKYEHSYPHCWRCDTPLINYATSSWFVNVTKIKATALETAKDVNWSPEYIKEGRFGNWLDGARDWSISRQRFWASVMPIWRCAACDHIQVFGSAQELANASGQTVTDLHKHVVDKVSYPCPSCGEGTMKRVPDVLDTWFDSGSMPYAQMHYPFENKEKFEHNFPAQFIAEGIDQTRTWFYYLHILGAGVMGKAAFKNVIVNGTVLAEDGKKMSKRLKNYPDPMLLMDKYGADAVRAYLLSSPVVQAENLNFSEKGVEEAMRKNIMMLGNIFSFYALYAEAGHAATAVSDHVLDIWILARLNQLIAVVTKAMNEYDLPRAMRPISEFIDELSTWYLRRSRDRFKEEGDDKEAVLATMKHVLVELSKVMAPFMPFAAEVLWQKVSGHDFSDDSRSVHLEAWPQSGETNESVLSEMAMVRRAVELGLAKRDEAKIKIRQPLQSLKLTSNRLKIENEALLELIKDELNVKEVVFVQGDEEIAELDTALTPELEKEGLKREIVRLVNQLRKQQGMTINDRIMLRWQSDDSMIQEVFTEYGDEIKNDTLSGVLEAAAEAAGEAQTVNGKKINLLINKI